MDTLRAESRRRNREERVAAPDMAPHRSSSLEEHDTREAVERGLARLPDDQREVLVLRLLAERSYKEIAEITGRKIGTVGWLVSVGLKALASELAPLVEGSAAVEPVMGRVAQGERS
jgi:RNA polymerase sigma-70 factor (ECF subfamily)